MHGLITYLFAIPLFPRGPWLLACGLSWFVFMVVFRAFFVFRSVPLRLFCFLFFSTRTSCLAPMARTLLGVLRQATLKFFVVATRPFLVSCVCPKFCDLAKQRRKI